MVRKQNNLQVMKFREKCTLLKVETFKVSVTSDNLPSLDVHVLKGINCKTEPSQYQLQLPIIFHCSLVVC